MTDDQRPADPPSVAVIIGASGAIGGAMAAALHAGGAFDHVLGFSRNGTGDGRIDLQDEASIIDAAAVAAAMGTVRLICVATGMLHGADSQPEKSWRQLDAARLAHSFAINSIGPALVAKHFLPLLPRSGRSVFAVLSARVGSIEDNRLGGWYGYRAAKAALNQIIRTLAIETARNRPEALCVALHPGTVDSALSRPFQGNVRPGGLFSAPEAAGHLLKVLDELSPADSGGLFAWDGRRIAF